MWAAGFPSSSLGFPLIFYLWLPHILVLLVSETVGFILEFWPLCLVQTRACLCLITTKSGNSTVPFLAPCIASLQYLFAFHLSPVPLDSAFKTKCCLMSVHVYVCAHMSACVCVCTCTQVGLKSSDITGGGTTT